LKQRCNFKQENKGCKQDLCCAKPAAIGSGPDKELTDSEKAHYDSLVESEKTLQSSTSDGKCLPRPKDDGAGSFIFDKIKITYNCNAMAISVSTLVSLISLLVTA
jgi:hypothetical protein